MVKKCEDGDWNQRWTQKHRKSNSWAKYQKSFKIPCKLCAKLISAHNMAKHLVIHSGVRKHKCMICSKAFSQGPDLRRHMVNVHGSLFSPNKSTMNMESPTYNPQGVGLSPGREENIM